MAIETPVNYATQYGRELDQVFPYVLNFGELYATPNNGRFRWVNAKTIEIPTVTTTGRVNGDRDTVAFAQRNYSHNWQTKTLTNERKWSTLVHPLAVITPHAYAFAQLDAPSAMSEGKYTYYEESFEYAFILNNKADSLQFNITPRG